LSKGSHFTVALVKMWSGALSSGSEITVSVRGGCIISVLGWDIVLILAAEEYNRMILLLVLLDTDERLLFVRLF
jgi:hypothetical protein